MTARPVPRFSTPVLDGPGDDPAFCTMGTGSFGEVKQPGIGVNHQPPSSAEVKDTVELYCILFANWHSPATLTEGFPCFFLSCRANARV